MDSENEDLSYGGTILVKSLAVKVRALARNTPKSNEIGRRLPEVIKYRVEAENDLATRNEQVGTQEITLQHFGGFVAFLIFIVFLVNVIARL
ncbi:MAG: hypothetical protein RBG13Loki_1448 [Promethearchaeota archaeon CR_4]|nr:MAG: hypothetical protein RBG13Loki_1448 [Candidatus Lokiarchaeota archaeon CR_4]